ncbi:uncharacterized protein Tco025E_01100 [Trypanosoma conorhini]|uniref:Uncharacterized protein n=1 Tax=Trypanosoma conorhini TaxID=83891 RepID=A0A3R7NTA4_9TRYP|nr:uncharacterized protein Tco025E_01100 [Trypanosoma conorhini]RNF26702.1 hypothetical protein Tco025E_01100 [Trypanosoma conorhini]
MIIHGGAAQKSFSSPEQGVSPRHDRPRGEGLELSTVSLGLREGGEDALVSAAPPPVQRWGSFAEFGAAGGRERGRASLAPTPSMAALASEYPQAWRWREASTLTLDPREGERGWQSLRAGDAREEVDADAASSSSSSSSSFTSAPISPSCAPYAFTSNRNPGEEDARGLSHAASNATPGSSDSENDGGSLTSNEDVENDEDEDEQQLRGTESVLRPCSRRRGTLQQATVPIYRRSVYRRLSDVYGHPDAAFLGQSFFRDKHSALEAGDSFQRSLSSQAFLPSQISGCSAFYRSKKGWSNCGSWMRRGSGTSVDHGVMVQGLHMQERRFPPPRYANVMPPQGGDTLPGSVDRLSSGALPRHPLASSYATSARPGFRSRRPVWFANSRSNNSWQYSSSTGDEPKGCDFSQADQPEAPSDGWLLQAKNSIKRVDSPEWTEEGRPRPPVNSKFQCMPYGSPLPHQQFPIRPPHSPHFHFPLTNEKPVKVYSSRGK